MKKLLILVFVVAYIANIQAQPTITTMAPLSTKIDSLVTINGSNFSTTANDNTVYFGAVKATVFSATANQLIVKVPLGASYAPISVTNAGLTATGNMPFSVVFDGQTTLNANTFNNKIDSAGNTPYRIISCDFDGDGKPDVAYGSFFSNDVEIYRNNSANNILSFESKVVIQNTYEATRIIAADIDGDGKKDLLVANFDGANYSVFRNTSTIGNISFAPQILFNMPTGSNTAFIKAGDIDGDGKLDVVVTNYPNNGFSIFRNLSTIGNINFDTRLDFATQGTYPTDIEIADLNNDGKKDIIIGNSQQYTVSVFQNASSVGNILLATPYHYAVTLGVHAIGVADLNNDGKLDIVTADFATPGAASYATTISILQNKTNAGASFNANSFYAAVPYTVGSGSSDIRFVDLDGDGKIDIGVGNFQSPYISLLKNISVSGATISLNPAINIVTGNQAAFLDFADFNLDGKPDIVVSNYGSNTISFLTNTISVLANENIKTFTATANNKIAHLQWQLNSINNIATIILQHSTNGNNWVNIYTEKDIKTQSNYVHSNTINGNNYYRLQQTNTDGKIIYSDIKLLTINSKLLTINIYPNPVQHGYFIIDLGKEITKNINYTIVGADGKIYKQGIITARQTTVKFNPTAKGTYYVQLNNETCQAILVD